MELKVQNVKCKVVVSLRDGILIFSHEKASAFAKATARQVSRIHRR